MNGEINMGRDLGLLLPEIAVLITAVLGLVAEILHKPRWSMIVIIAGLLVATGLTLPLVGMQTSIFMGTFRIDTFSIWAKLIILPLVALIVMLAVPDVRGSDREGTVYSLLAFTTLGTLALAGAGDIMFIILGLLLSSLGSFALVAYPRTNRATEAGMKYFVYGSVAEAVMIFGLTFWFGATGSTLLQDLARLQTHSLAGMAGLVAVLIGLGYKAAIAPFHFWAPDAYEGGPISVAAFLSTAPKIGAIFGLAQVLRNIPLSAVNWTLVVALLAIFSMTYGNAAALSQTSLVRLLAYSSIAQAGYFLLGIVAVGKSELAIPALVTFAAAYAAMNLGSFAIVARVGPNLSDFQGLGRAMPWTGGTMVIFLLSLVGVPPLAGFTGKLFLFGAALESGFSWLAVAAILNSVLSLAVYLRIIIPMYRPGEPVTTDAPLASLAQSVALFITLILGISVQIILSYTLF